MADEIKKNATEMDWDSPISADASKGEFNLPPVGEYGFTVIEFEKTISKSGKKMAKLNLELDEKGQFFKIYDYILLSLPWKCAQFFESLGLKKPNEGLERMPWDKVLGATGRVKIKHETYNGTESCKVDKYIVPLAAQAPSAPDEEMPFEV